MNCSCKEFEINGLPCSHIYSIVGDLNKYEEPSHHECAVRWWTSYDIYSNNVNPSNETEENLSTLHNALSKKDIKGFPITKDMFNYTPIVTIGSGFGEYHVRKYPLMSNYPGVKVGYDSLLSLNPINLTEVIDVNNEHISQEESNPLMLELEKNFRASQEEVENISDNVYGALIPSFKELVDVMEGNCEKEDVKEIQMYIMEKIADFRGRALLQDPKERNARTVSSGVIQNKRTKTHGCRSYRKK